jgi:hypothetical protein
MCNQLFAPTETRGEGEVESGKGEKVGGLVGQL